MLQSRYSKIQADRLAGACRIVDWWTASDGRDRGVAFKHFTKNSHRWMPRDAYVRLWMHPGHTRSRSYPLANGSPVHALGISNCHTKISWSGECGQ